MTLITTLALFALLAAVVAGILVSAGRLVIWVGEKYGEPAGVFTIIFLVIFGFLSIGMIIEVVERRDGHLSQPAPPHRGCAHP